MYSSRILLLFWEEVMCIGWVVVVLFLIEAVVVFFRSPQTCRALWILEREALARLFRLIYYLLL